MTSLFIITFQKSCINIKSAQDITLKYPGLDVKHGVYTCKCSFSYFSLLYATKLHRTKKRICIKFALCKYVASMSFAQLCTHCMCGDGRNCPFLCKFGHRHLCTDCKALRIAYLQHICTRQIWANSIFHPVLAI